jgi:thioredoxin 1
MAITLTDNNFDQEVIQSKSLVLVDFWAEWCGPCKAIAPIIENLANKYNSADQVKICKLDVDENPETQSKFRIMSIPTLLFFQNGEIVNTIVGARPEEYIEDEIAKFL